MRVGPRAANSAQRGQAHHDVAQPVNFLDENARGGGSSDDRRRCRRAGRQLVITPNIFRFHPMILRSAMRSRQRFHHAQGPNKPAHTAAAPADPTKARGVATFRIAADRTTIRLFPIGESQAQGIDAMAGLRDRPLMRDALLAGAVIAASAVGRIDRARSRPAIAPTFRFRNFGARAADSDAASLSRHPAS